MLPCCYILKSRQLQALTKNQDENRPIISPHSLSTSSDPNHSHCVLCKYQIKFLHSGKMRLILNAIITGSLLVFLLVSCTTALFWHPRNICEQNPAPLCEAGEYLQSQFIASTNESEIMNCSPYSTFERKLWFDCVVSSEFCKTLIYIFKIKFLNRNVDSLPVGFLLRLKMLKSASIVEKEMSIDWSKNACPIVRTPKN